MFAARKSRGSCIREISPTRRSSRVQKNENYLSAEQCRLTVLADQTATRTTR